MRTILTDVPNNPALRCSSIFFGPGTSSPPSAISLTGSRDESRPTLSSERGDLTTVADPLFPLGFLASVVILSWADPTLCTVRVCTGRERAHGVARNVRVLVPYRYCVYGMWDTLRRQRNPSLQRHHWRDQHNLIGDVFDPRPHRKGSSPRIKRITAKQN